MSDCDLEKMESYMMMPETVDCSLCEYGCECQEPDSYACGYYGSEECDPFGECAVFSLKTKSCENCKTETAFHLWNDAGTCNDGCCDKYKCPECGYEQLFDVGQ